VTFGDGFKCDDVSARLVHLPHAVFGKGKLC
jgi:hypothetical protein